MDALNTADASGPHLVPVNLQWLTQRVRSVQPSVQRQRLKPGLWSYRHYRYLVALPPQVHTRPVATTVRILTGLVAAQLIFSLLGF